MNAPKKIWADGEMVGGSGFASCFDEPMGGGYTKYIREDVVLKLVDALEAVLPFTYIGNSEEANEATSKAVRVLTEIKAMEEECSTQ